MKKNIFIAIVIALSSAISAKNIFIKASATGAADGSSWTDAYATLGAAFANDAHGDSIYIAAGSYTESASITLDQLVSIKGGYAGTEDVTTTLPDYAANKALLRCSSSNPLFKVNFTTNPSITGKLIIKGLTFKGTVAGGSYGAAISALQFYNQLEIAYCDFIENSTATGKGGAIYMVNTAAVSNLPFVIYGCNFIKNTSPEGGAIDIYASTGSTVFTVDHCNFVKNTATAATAIGTGGAIYLREGLTVNLKNSVFRGNSANSSGGALWIYRRQTVNISDCQFEGNTTYTSLTGTTLKGSAIFSNVASAGTNNSTINLVRTVVANNNALTTAQRGAIEANNNQATTITYTDSYITNNKPTGSSTYLYGRDVFLNPYHTNFTAHTISNSVINGQKIVSGNVDADLVDKTNGVTSPYPTAKTYADYYTQKEILVKEATKLKASAALFVNTPDEVNVPFVDISTDSVKVKIVKNSVNYSLATVSGTTASVIIDIQYPGTYDVQPSAGYKMVDNTNTTVTTLNAPGTYNLTFMLDTATKNNEIGSKKPYISNSCLFNIEAGSQVICYDIQGIKILEKVSTSESMKLPTNRMLIVKINSLGGSTVIR